MGEWLLIYKIVFVICLVLVSLSLITWKLRNFPSWLRKPLVLIIYPLSVIPKIILSLHNLHRKQFWIELKQNFLIAWNGNKHGNI